MSKLVQKVQYTAKSKEREKKEKKDRRRHIDVTSVAIVLRSTTVF